MISSGMSEDFRAQRFHGPVETGTAWNGGTVVACVALRRGLVLGPFP